MENLLNKYERILITGGAGFIGGALIRNLLLRSKSKIYNLDKVGYASDFNGIKVALSQLKEKDQKRYKFLKVDLSNLNDVNEVINSLRPQLVFNLAAETHVDRSIDNPIEFINSNIIGTFNLLQAVRTLFEKDPDIKSGNFRFHHISTDEVFGSLGDIGYFSEKSRYDPRSPYSASKAASDHLVSAWHHTYGLPTIITNCSNNYGPWQFPEKLIPLVINKIIDGEKIPMYGKGNNIRDWLYVDDHIEALVLCATKGNVGKTYCIGGNSEITNKKVILDICEYLDDILHLKKSSKELIKEVEDRPGHDYRYSIDSSFIRNELGWQPKYKFKDGLKSTINWYLDNRNWCREVLKKANYDKSRIGLI